MMNKTLKVQSKTQTDMDHLHVIKIKANNRLFVDNEKNVRERKKEKKNKKKDGIFEGTLNRSGGREGRKEGGRFGGWDGAWWELIRTRQRQTS